MATKKITLKDKGNNELYPKTAAQLVQVSKDENLVQYLAKIILGTIPVGKATNAETATYLYFDNPDEDKEDKIGYDDLIDAAASKAVADVGTTLLPSYYTKDQIDTKLQGVGKIGAATRGGAGIVRLATQEEVDSGEVTENIPEGGNPGEPPAVVVTPMTLAKKLENYATPGDVATEVAKIVANADTDFDTLKEIADWILNDTTGAAAMANDISALKKDVETAETDISNLKTKDESHDQSLLNLDSNKADKTTVTNLQNKVSGIETTTNNNDTTLKNIIGVGVSADNIQSVALAIKADADSEGNQFSTKYAKKTDIKEVDKTTVEGLIGVSGLTYSEDGTVTY